MSKVSNEEIMKDYWNNIKKYDIKEKCYKNKYNGNIFAMIMAKYIQKIIDENNLNYKVSLNNSYISKCPIEWDLLILKENIEHNEINIYEPNDVKCVLEFKTASHFGRKKLKSIFNKNIKKYKNYGVTNKIPFAYISLFQNKNYPAYDILNEKFENLYFFREDTSAKEPEDPKADKETFNLWVKSDADGSFENFIIDLLKK